MILTCLIAFAIAPLVKEYKQTGQYPVVVSKRVISLWDTNVKYFPQCTAFYYFSWYGYKYLLFKDNNTVEEVDFDTFRGTCIGSYYDGEARKQAGWY